MLNRCDDRNRVRQKDTDLQIERVKAAKVTSKTTRPTAEREIHKVYMSSTKLHPVGCSRGASSSVGLPQIG